MVGCYNTIYNVYHTLQQIIDAMLEPTMWNSSSFLIMQNTYKVKSNLNKNPHIDINKGPLIIKLILLVANKGYLY